MLGLGLPHFEDQLGATWNDLLVFSKRFWWRQGGLPSRHLNCHKVAGLTGLLRTFGHFRGIVCGAILSTDLAEGAFGQAEALSA